MHYYIILQPVLLPTCYLVYNHQEDQNEFPSRLHAESFIIQPVVVGFVTGVSMSHQPEGNKRSSQSIYIKNNIK